MNKITQVPSPSINKITQPQSPSINKITQVPSPSINKIKQPQSPSINKITQAPSHSMNKIKQPPSQIPSSSSFPISSLSPSPSKSLPKFAVNLSKSRALPIPSRAPPIPSRAPPIPSRAPPIPSPAPPIPSPAPPIPSHAPPISSPALPNSTLVSIPQSNIINQQTNTLIKEDPIIDICFMFLASDGISNHKIWETFFNNLDSRYTYSIYIHDESENSQLYTGIFKDKVILEKTSNNNVKATLLLLKHILLKEAKNKNKHKKYVLLCGKSVPLVSADIFFETVLEDDKSWLNNDLWMILNEELAKFIINNNNDIDNQEKDYFIKLVKNNNLEYLDKAFMWSDESEIFNSINDDMVESELLMGRTIIFEDLDE